MSNPIAWLSKATQLRQQKSQQFSLKGYYFQFKLYFQKQLNFNMSKYENQLQQTSFLQVDYLTNIIQADPTKLMSDTSPDAKISYYLYANGIRILRRFTDQAAQFFHTLTLTTESDQIFFVIMIVSVMITIASVSIIFFQIWQFEHIQSDILSLYAYLSKDHIKDTYSKALDFMREIAEGSFVKQISPYQMNPQGQASFYQTSLELDANIDVKRHQKNKNSTIYALMLRRSAQEIRELLMPNDYKAIPVSKDQIKSSDKMHQSQSQDFKIDKTKSLKSNKQKTMKKDSGKRGAKARKLNLDSLDQKPSKKELGKSQRALVFSQKNGMKYRDEDDIEEEDESHHHSKDDSEEFKSNDMNHNKRQLQSHHIKKDANSVVISEIEERKAQFKRTYVSKNSKTKISVFLVSLFITAYFIAVYLLQNQQVSDLTYVERLVPMFYDRCRYLMLAFGIARERVFQNNTMTSFEYDPLYGHDIDTKYNDYSISNEYMLTSWESLGLNKLALAPLNLGRGLNPNRYPQFYTALVIYIYAAQMAGGDIFALQPRWLLDLLPCEETGCVGKWKSAVALLLFLHSLNQFIQLRLQLNLI